MDVSIIIVNWNTCEILRNCLVSVYEQTRGIEFEVIVVDNNSSDDSVHMLKQEYPQVVLIENASNVGFAAANNQGMAMASGRYFLLLNSDTLILDEAIPKTVLYADNHSEAGIVGCRTLNRDRTPQHCCFTYPSLLNLILAATSLNKLFPKSQLCGRELMTWWDQDDERELEVVTGCFMLVRREAYLKVGGMDESFFMYAEETDWCYRFKQTGWRILFNPNAEIIHLGGQSTQQMKPTMTLQKRAAILLFMKKHYSMIDYWLACLFTGLFFLIRIPYWFLKGLNDTEARGMCSAYCRGLLTPFTGWKGLRYHP